MDNSCLQTELCGLKLNTPIFAASGTFGFGEEFADFVDLKRLGGVMVKCITLKPRRGNDGVRITETPAGMLNSIGLENPGIETFLAKSTSAAQASKTTANLQSCWTLTAWRRLN